MNCVLLCVPEKEKTPEKPLFSGVLFGGGEGSRTRVHTRCPELTIPYQPILLAF